MYIKHLEQDLAQLTIQPKAAVIISVSFLPQITTPLNDLEYIYMEK